MSVIQYTVIVVLLFNTFSFLKVLNRKNVRVNCQQHWAFNEAGNKKQYLTILDILTPSLNGTFFSCCVAFRPLFYAPIVSFFFQANF